MKGGVELVLDATAEFCRGLGDVGHWQVRGARRGGREKKVGVRIDLSLSVAERMLFRVQDMQSGLGGGTVDSGLLEFEAGLEQEAGARMRRWRISPHPHFQPHPYPQCC